MSTALEGRVAIVTGATSGIGWATAAAFAEHGGMVTVTGRREERLLSLANHIGPDRALAAHGDIARRGDVEAVVDQTVERFGRVDVLVNNAGVMLLSPASQRLVDEWDRMIDVNIKGVLYGVAAVLPVMNRQGSGQIINVSSIGGLSVVPTAAVYCATKYAVRAISDGLRQENDRIRVTCVYPGVVESELADTITDPVAADAMIAYRKIALKPEAIAAAIAHVIAQPADVDTSEIVVRPTASV